MKRRPSLLQKLWRKLRSPKPVEKRFTSARKVGSSLEVLEGRIAPAALINPTTLVYKDFDGDIVTVKFTKALFAAGDNTGVNDIFKFNLGTVDDTTIAEVKAGPSQQLQLIDLTKVAIVNGANRASQTGISVTVVKTGGGNGQADIGYINGTGLSLGAVSIAGDLGQIDAGVLTASSSVTGLASLKVKTLGARDPLETQQATGRSLISNIVGTLGSLTVTGSVTDASILVVGGGAGGVTGKIGNVTIGGSLVGTAATGSASDGTGFISSSGDIGLIKIGTLSTDGILGGGGNNSGAVKAVGAIAGLTVNGGIKGSTGTFSGSVVAGKTLGPVVIHGSLSGGTADNSGSITAAGMGTLTIDGSILGGAAGKTGLVASTGSNGFIGAIVIGGDIKGDTTIATDKSTNAGAITATGQIASLKVVGSILGGQKTVTAATTPVETVSSGYVTSSNSIGAISIGGAIKGGAGMSSGSIVASGNITSLTVLGTDGISGSTGVNNGYVQAGGTIGTVAIKGSLTGGVATKSGSIFAGALGAVTINGSITAGGAASTGLISSTSTIGAVYVGGDIDGKTDISLANYTTSGGIAASSSIASIKVIGSILGGDVSSSGYVFSGGNIGAVNVAALTGGAGLNSGSIIAGGSITTLTVGANGITGSTGITSGYVHADGLIGAIVVKGSLTGGAASNSGSISAALLSTVTINGSIKAGAAGGTGLVSSLRSIGAVYVGGDIQGNTDIDSTSSVTAGGVQAEGKITSVKIVGALTGGAGTSSGFVNSGVDIGAISVASITGGTGQGSGAITASGKIASLTVPGTVTGGAGVGSGSVSSGLDTNQVGDMGAVKIGGKLIGGSADTAGTINSGGKITSVTIGPAAAVAGDVVLQGAAGNFSGSVVSHGAIGTVKITGNVEGGGGSFSGSVRSQDLINSTLEIAGNIGAVTIVGHLRGGSGADSGTIQADGNLTSVTVGDSAGEGLTGGAGSHSGSIRAGQGVVNPGTITTVTVKGTLAGLTNSALLTGAIVSEGHIGTVSVKGAAAGGAIRSGEAIGTLTFSSDVVGTNISAVGLAIQKPTADLAIAKISILGSATNATIRAGYDTSGSGVNPDAQIGTISVTGNWTAGNIMAGTTPGTGTLSDVKVSGTDNAAIVSQIASIVIKGNVAGTDAGTNNTDHFGFSAQRINSVSVHGVLKTFSAATPAETLELGSTGDFTAREIAVVV